MKSQHNPVVLEPTLVEFLTSHLCIIVSASRDQRSPTVVNGIGCRVDAERAKITVLFSRNQGETVIRAIKANQKIAVVFSQPESHRTMQLKGLDAIVTEPTDDDRALLGPYQKRISQRLSVYGVSEIYAHTLWSCDPDDLVTVSFTPVTAFRQTPGESAGDKMPLGSALP